MEQVIVNLVTNARDAMPEGGRLSISTSNRDVSTASTSGSHVAPGDYVALVVSDEGDGMTEDVRRRLFEPFFSTKPREKGIGLGLATVQGIVASAGGDISVDSVPGRGTTATVLFPRSRGQAADGEPGSGQAVSPDGDSRRAS